MKRNPRDIIIRPIITEKTVMMQQNDNKVTFEVAKGSNKVEVRQAIEEIFNVKVEKVNMVNAAPKKKRMGRYEGYKPSVRKAIVKLADGHSIEIL